MPSVVDKTPPASQQELDALWGRFGLAMQDALRRGWRISLRVEIPGKAPVELPFADRNGPELAAPKQ
jgi:hypothetical protein